MLSFHVSILSALSVFVRIINGKERVQGLQGASSHHSMDFGAKDTSIVRLSMLSTSEMPLQVLRDVGPHLIP